MRLVEKLIVKSLQFYWRQSRGLALGVQAIVRDATGRVLLVREGPEAAWSLPKCAVNSNEAAPMAVVRLLSDLAGIEAGPPSDLRLVDHVQDAAPNLHLAVYAVIVERAPAPARPGTAAFFALDALPASLADGDKRRLADVLPDATR